MFNSNDFYLSAILYIPESAVSQAEMNVFAFILYADVIHWSDMFL